MVWFVSVNLLQQRVPCTNSPVQLDHFTIKFPIGREKTHFMHKYILLAFYFFKLASVGTFRVLATLWNALSVYDRTPPWGVDSVGVSILLLMLSCCTQSPGWHRASCLPERLADMLSWALATSLGFLSGLGFLATDLPDGLSWLLSPVTLRPLPDAVTGDRPRHDLPSGCPHSDPK